MFVKVEERIREFELAQNDLTPLQPVRPDDSDDVSLYTWTTYTCTVRVMHNNIYDAVMEWDKQVILCSLHYTCTHVHAYLLACTHLCMYTSMMC